MKKTVQRKQSKIMDDVETCQSCGNVYLIIWLEQSQNYNDFGLRHCPFCGLVVDEMTKSVVA